MKRKRSLLLLLFFVPIQLAFAQSDSVKPVFELRLFADAYYGYDFDQPQTSTRQFFLYNYNRHNQFNVNLAFLQFNVSHERYRAQLGVQGGSYVQDNYSSEPSALRYFSEAAIGIKILKKRALWLDVGILPSHIGSESAISSENICLTRSLIAETTPYYMAGAKLNYAFKGKWEAELIACNGWQQIYHTSGNSLISMGSRLTYTDAKFKFNWSTFVGANQPDTYRKMRYFSNLYTKHQIGKKAEMVLNLDLGAEQTIKNSQAYNYWMGAAALFQYSFTERLKLGSRIEFYTDPNRVFMFASPEGFKTAGYSLNLDYVVAPGVQLRLEGRVLDFINPIFTLPNFTTKTGINTFICASLSADLKHVFK